MEPVPTQSAYADSDHVPRDFRSLIIKFGLSLIGLLILLGMAGYFLWPGPQQRMIQELQIIEAAFDANDLDGALTKADEALKENPRSAEILIAKSLILAQKGSLEFKEAEYGTQAVAAAEKAISINPNNSEGFRALAYAYEIQGNYQKAHENYNKALKLEPQNVAAMYGNAHSYDLEGNMIKAEEGYRLALGTDPSFDQAYVGVARALVARGDVEGAIEMLKKAFELSQNLHIKAESAYSIARIALSKKDVPLALYYAQQSITLDPEYPLGWYIHGTALFVDSFNEEKYPNPEDRGALMRRSIAALQRSVILYPNQTLAHFQLGTELSAVGSRAQGERAFQKALEVIDKDITLSAGDKVAVRAQIIEAQKLAAKVAAVQAANTPNN